MDNERVAQRSHSHANAHGRGAQHPTDKGVRKS